MQAHDGRTALPSLLGHDYWGVILETLGPMANDTAAHQRWRELVCRISAALGWPDCQPVMQVGPRTTMLAFRAPADVLLLATDINEWAWEMALDLIGSTHAAPGYDTFDAMHQAYDTVDSALAWFQQRRQSEANPPLLALFEAAHARGIPVLVDDDSVSIGCGQAGQTWPLSALPALVSVPWPALHGIPTAMVSGTNGKTTSVRLLAACARAAGFSVGHCCTDGVFVNGVESAAGDYSGPGGARAVLRQATINHAVLEVARGGILRRGLALDHADVALITNISPEHYGEYGVECIEDLADVKLVLAQALGPDGTLVINADDPVLLPRARQAGQHCALALFALDYAAAPLQAQRAQGAACCGVRNGHLVLFYQGVEHDLGSILAMPLTVEGSAQYNIANCAGAALAAACMGLAPDVIARVLAEFGRHRHDNPGRLERWNLPGLTVLLDYAHNPEGLTGLINVAQGLLAHASTMSPASSKGRLGLLLGQAGNRSNDAIAELAQTAARFQPDHIVLKDIAGYIRGRSEGEVPGILRTALLAGGMQAQRIITVLPEVEAALSLLRWARTGDVLVLPVHDKSSKQQMQQILDKLEATGWHCGHPLPGPDPAAPSLPSTS